jgi:hypothetical protein
MGMPGCVSTQTQNFQTSGCAILLDRKGLCDTPKTAIAFNVKRIASSFHAPQHRRRTSGPGWQLQQVPDYRHLLGYSFVDPISKQVVAVRADNLRGCLTPTQRIEENVLRFGLAVEFIRAKDAPWHVSLRFS